MKQLIYKTRPGYDSP